MLAKHIAFLLRHHDCLIVPRLGGFVVQQSRASCKTDVYAFTPPSRIVSFNQELKHNDGLLIESYMRALKANYQDARRRVETDIEAMLITLKESRNLLIEGVGIISINSEGLIDFQRNTGALLNVAHYGLPEVRLLPLQQLKKEAAPAPEPVSDSENIYFRINRALLRNVAAAAAIIALVLCISIPVNPPVDTGQMKAGFLPASSPIAIVDEASVEQPATIVTQEVKNEATEPAQAVQPIAVAEQPKPLPKAVVTPAVNPQSAYYYIIVASCPDIASAKSEVSKLKNKGFETAGVVTGGGRSRVYSAKFATKQEADEKLAFYCKQLNRHDAWVLKSK